MDSNKNEECCYNANGGRLVGAGGRTAVIAVDCIGKAISAAKYQNQFNNNNLIEQENLMPTVHERVSGMMKDDESSSAVPHQNGAVANDLTVKEKVLAENGSTRHVSAIFSQPSPTACASINAPSERIHPGQQNGVECLTSITISSTTNTNSFNPTTNGTGPGHHELAVDVSNDRRELTLKALTAELNDVSDLPDDGELSDNNSIGNPSCSNGLIQDIILLPDNAYSDDDNASTSDDCIYAYRGEEPAGAGRQLLELQGDLPPDEETDFLEMDFDPEPSSEMENVSRHQDALQDMLDVMYIPAARPTDGKQGQEPFVTRSPSPESRSPTIPLMNVVAYESRASPSENGMVRDKIPSESSDEAAQIVGLNGTIGTVPEPFIEDGENCKVKDVIDIVKKPIHNTDSASEQSVGLSQAHKTGAIPKSMPMLASHSSSGGREGSSNSKNLKLDLGLLSDETDGAEKHRFHQYSLFHEPREYVASGQSRGLNENGEETQCLNCAGQEFFMYPKQIPARFQFCNVCQRGINSTKKANAQSSLARANSYFYDSLDHHNRSSEEEDELLNLRAEQIVFETLHKINTLKETPPSGRLSRIDERSIGKPRTPELTEGHHRSGLPPDQVVPIDYHEQAYSEHSVTIYTINCNKLTIIEALTRIGIVPNLNVLEQHFLDQYEVDTTKMTIPQYLLHMSKRDCNYKKLIEAIKSCCDDKSLDVQYYPLDPFSDAPEVVQISSVEIAKRWNANTNLRQIIHFKHKHFHSLNVLGKIVNILRQPSRGRRTNHMISIPQYYKSGSITITRTGGS